MFRVEMLPAACGDCLWIEYGELPATRVVIIDGGVRATAPFLRERIAVARKERQGSALVIELLIVTHIDNDHIQGVIELLKAAGPDLQIKDIWFNGRPQLNTLPAQERIPPQTAPSDSSEFLGRRPVRDECVPSPTTCGIAADFLGTAEGDELSTLLEDRAFPWNCHPLFDAAAVSVTERGDLPVITLDGGLKLTLLGPTLARLHDLRRLWGCVRRGDEDPPVPDPSEFLARADRWPPTWKDEEQDDRSVTNGSSIVLLANFEGAEILLAGDACASDIAVAIDRVRGQRKLTMPLPLRAFKLPHHGSARNLSREILEKIDCRCFLISTDGSLHRHPDHLALLRVLRYSRGPSELFFNYASPTTLRWGESKADILRSGFPDYVARYPSAAPGGSVLVVA